MKTSPNPARNDNPRRPLLKGASKTARIPARIVPRAHGCDLLTIGPYLQPGGAHLAVERPVHPDQFDESARIGHAPGFRHVASGPPVRSSYRAERQAHGL